MLPIIVNVRTKGFTIVEMLLTAFLLGFVMLIFFYLFKTGLIASSKGETAALTRETARTALERIQSELRQAVPIPGGSDISVPAVILPGTGGPLLSIEASSIGCSVMSGCVFGANNMSVLVPSVTVTAPFAKQIAAGPSGFLIFSELKQTAAAGGNISTSSDPNFALNVANYVWVMFQVNPAVGIQPAQIVRYTFNVLANGTDITAGPGGWTRTNAYFVPANSIENTANPRIPPLVIASLNNPATDQLWVMASHPAATISLQNTTGMLYDPQLFVITCIVQESSLIHQQSKAPLDTAILSSQVKVEGGKP